MFLRAASLFSLAVLAVATNPTVTVTVTKTAEGGGNTQPASSCSTGSLKCCNSVQKASDPGPAAILGLLGIVVKDLNVLVGLDCSPINIIGGGGGSCNAKVVCCQDNSHDNLISIGCVPVIL